MIDSTDVQGKAKVLIRYGRVSGAAWVVMTVPEYGIKDSIRFDVEPGSPSRVHILPRDTAVVAGRQYSLRASTADRFGNPRSDAVTYQSITAGVSVDGAGRVTTTMQGRGRMLISAGAARDTAFVSAVPNGRFVATQSDAAFNSRVIAVDFDAGNHRVLAPNAFLPRVSVNGRIIVHVGSEVSTARMHFVEPDGSLRRITPISTSLEGEAYGHLAADGWIYFSGSYPADVFTLWRVLPDGSSQERVTNGHADWRSWPSPDGTKLVFSRYTNNWETHVMDIATRQTTSLRVQGLGAAWSPNGQRVVVPPNEERFIKIVNADGSNLQIVANTEFTFGDSADWTADGQYLITRTRSGVELIRVTDGERLPLKFADSMHHPVRAP